MPISKDSIDVDSIMPKYEDKIISIILQYEEHSARKCIFQIEIMILFKIGWSLLLLGTVRSQECFPEIIGKTFVHVVPTAGFSINKDSSDDCLDASVIRNA